MRYVIFIFVTVLCIAVTCGMFGASPIANGIVPDLLISFIVAIALSEKSVAVLFMAAIAGAVTDVLFSEAVGMIAIPYLVAAALTLILCTKFRLRTYFIAPLILAFAAQLVFEIGCMAASAAFGNGADMIYMLYRYVLPGCAITAIVTPLTYLIVRKVFSLKLVRAVRVSDIKRVGLS